MAADREVTQLGGRAEVLGSIAVPVLRGSLWHIRVTIAALLD